MSDGVPDTFEVTIVPLDGPGLRVVQVPYGERVLLDFHRRGIADVPIGCRGGGCGVCRVKVSSGSYYTKKMSRKHISPSDEEHGIVLACRLIPLSDLTIQPAPVETNERADATPTNKETPSWQ